MSYACFALDRGVPFPNYGDYGESPFTRVIVVGARTRCKTVNVYVFIIVCVCTCVVCGLARGARIDTHRIL